MHDASISVVALHALHSQPAPHHVQWIRCAHPCMRTECQHGSRGMRDETLEAILDAGTGLGQSHLSTSRLL